MALTWGARWPRYLQRLAAVSESCAAASNQARPHRRLDVPLSPFPQVFSFLSSSDLYHPWRRVDTPLVGTIGGETHFRVSVWEPSTLMSFPTTPASIPLYA